MPKATRRLFVGLLIFLLHTSICAADGEILGSGHFAFKAGLIQLIDDEELWELSDLEDDNYFAINWYGNLARNLYIGFELGYAEITGEAFGIDTRVVLIPAELNLKYSLGLRNMHFNFGIGVCYIKTYGTIVLPPMVGTLDDFFHERSIYGAQGFAEFNLKLSRYFVGAHAKYQITEDLVDTINLDNYQFGVHVGITFE